MKRSRRAAALALTSTLAVAIGMLPATGAFAAAGYPNPATNDPTDVEFSAGAYIIDAGAVTTAPITQGVSKGLKSYGLIYALVKARIPVQWVINPSKAAIDQTNGNIATDFAFDCDGAGGGASKNYKTGAFVIEKQFSKAAKAIVDTWKTKGVVVDGPCAADTPVLPVFATIRTWPRTVINTSNASIAEAFFTAAGIPQGTTGDPLNPQAYRTALPAELTSCDDVFAMPHADPTFANHSKLIEFVKGGGSIWAGCHAVSVLENITYPSGDDAGKLAMNFLSTDGLLAYGSHDGGSTPYAFFKAGTDSNTYYPSSYTLESVRPGDPIAQFLGRTDAAHTNGSEQIYMPKAGSKWRETTQIVEYDPTQANVTSKSPGPAAVLAYGPAYGDPNNGLVMYESGHDIYKATDPANVAAVRAFFNLLLLSAVGGAGGVPKAPTVSISAPAADAAPYTAGDTVTVEGDATGGSGSNTYGWSSACFDASSNDVGSGTFDSATSKSTTFTAPAVPSLSTCNLTLTVIDSCGHVSFETRTISVKPAPETLDISITKTAPAKVLLGADFDYTIVVKNNGGIVGTTASDGLVAKATELTDTMPTGVTFVSVGTPSYSGTTPANASACTTAGDPVVVTCPLGDMEDEQTATIIITVNMASPVASVTNVASVSTSGNETYKANNDDSAKSNVTLPPTGGGADLVLIVSLVSIGLGGFVLAASRRRRLA